MTTHKNTKVIIVGAGPTGLTLACQLFRYGIDFIIIEKNEHTTHLSKAMVVHARSMEIFAELGLADTFIEKGQVTERFNIMSNGKIAERLELSEFGQGLTPFPYIITIEQSKTEKIMVDYLTEKQVAIEWGSELLKVENTPTHIKAKYRDKTGNIQTIQADFLVGCDGADSLVRHQLDIPFVGNTDENTFYLADVKIQSDIVNQKEAYMNMIADSFVLMFGMKEDQHYRIIGVLPDTDELRNISEPQFSDIKEIIKKQVKTPLTFVEEYWFSTYKVHSCIAENFQKGRCFLAGDASHIHTPAGGQGMNTGIQDAYNLAWKLAFVLTRKATPDLLKSYNEERIANAEHLLDSTDKLFEFIMGENIFVNFLKLHVFPYAAKIITNTQLGSKAFFPFVSQIAIAYPDSSQTITSKIGKVAAGDRMPYFVTDTGKGIFEKIVSNEYKLLYFGKGDGFAKLNLINFKGIQLSLATIPPVFGDNEDFYVVVRPDNHIAYLGRDLEVVQQCLKL